MTTQNARVRKLLYGAHKELWPDTVAAIIEQAVIIPRTDLEPVDQWWGDRPADDGYLVGDVYHEPTTAVEARAEALRWLSLAEHLDANPPAVQEQRSLSGRGVSASSMRSLAMALMSAARASTWRVLDDCLICQGTGMATLNPDEEPGSHICVSAEEDR